MKWLRSRRTRAYLGLAACALFCAAAAPGLAQTEPQLDFEIVNVEIEISEKSEEFQAIVTVGLSNLGNLATHALQVALYYGPIGMQLIEDMVVYIQENHDCWQLSQLGCHLGSCLDINTFSGWWEGHCINRHLWYCGCSYEVHLYFAPIPIDPAYPIATIIVDPNNLVEEYDETNNEYIIDLAAVATEAKTWSTVKSLYQ